MQAGRRTGCGPFWMVLLKVYFARMIIHMSDLCMGNIHLLCASTKSGAKIKMQRFCDCRCYLNMGNMGSLVGSVIYCNKLRSYRETFHSIRSHPLSISYCFFDRHTFKFNGVFRSQAVCVCVSVPSTP